MLTLGVHVNGDRCWPDLVKQDGTPNYVEGRWVGIARLPGGTASGKSTVTIRIELPDGRTVLAQTTLALLTTAVGAFNAVEERQQP